MASAVAVAEVPTQELADLPLELIDIGENVRTDPGELVELAASIAELGVLQPIRAIGPDAAGRYRAVWGQRRIMASIIAKLDTIPALVEPFAEANLPGPRRSIEQLAENLQRKDLNPIEEAVALREVLDGTPGLTQEQLADKLGRSRPWVSNTLRLLDVAEPVQDKVRSGEISASHAKAIAALPAKQQNELADRAVVAKWSAHDLEREIKWKQDEATQAERKAAKTEKWIPKTIAALEAAGVAKTASVAVTGGYYDLDVDAIRKAVHDAGWKHTKDTYPMSRPDGCDCTAVRIDVGGRKAAITEVCVDTRHRDRATNDEHLARKAREEERARQAQLLFEAAAPHVKAIPTPIARVYLYQLQRSGGGWSSWSAVAEYTPDQVAAMLLDYVTSGWGTRDIDFAQVLTEIGVEAIRKGAKDALAVLAEGDTAPGSEGGALPRGACSVCGRDVALRKRGLVREHRPVEDRRDETICSGSGKAAAL